MAEIASSFPTAGGLYYWASKLGSPGWGWATGWFNLIGQIAVTAAIGYGLSTFATVLFDDLFSLEKHLNDWFGFDYNETVYALYALFLLAACLINVFDVRITSLLNTVSAYWHMAGVAVIVLVLIVVPDHHQSARYVFGGQVNATGYGDNATGFHHADVLARLRPRPADGPVHDHGLRRLGAHGRGDPPGLADGRGRHVHVRRRLGDLRLHPARRGDLRDPEHPGRARQHRRGGAVDLVDVDEPELVGRAALHLRGRPVLLPDRLDDLGFADDVRLLARRRRARASVLAPRLEAPRPGARRVRDRRALRRC